MNILISGSIKVDSWARKKIFSFSLKSLKPIESVLVWNINIVGKYATAAGNEIKVLYKDAKITHDDHSSYYEIIKNQLSGNQSSSVLFWQEDHWFLCPNEHFFFYLLDRFLESKSEILTISHLTVSWETKPLLPILKDAVLYKEYQVDRNSQKVIWQKYPTAYLTGIPAIYKKEIASEILEFNKPHISNTKNPHGFEIDREKGEQFLKEKSFIEMVPTFHVFREVFKSHQNERSIPMRKALAILKMREQGNL